MFLFGHLGFAASCGVAAYVIEDERVKRRDGVSLPRFDWRYLLLGALLPDIIDKPLSEVIFSPYFHSGRIFGHTLLLLIILVMVGIARYRSKGDTRILLLALGCAAHLIADAIWQYPATVFWPLLGWFRQEINYSLGISGFLVYLSENSVFFTEMSGMVLLIILMRATGIRSFSAAKKFLKTGELPVLAG